MSIDIFQQVFALSVASNLIMTVKGKQKSLQEELQRRISDALLGIGTNWQVVFGPVVWKHDQEDAETGPDNSWYIAFHPRLQFEDGSIHPTYVIGIAGTPEGAPHVWKEQTLAIGTVADFTVWVKGGIENRPVEVFPKDIVEGKAYLTTGMANTVYLLLTTPAPANAASPRTTLFDFITNVDKSESPRFIVTGHSLGGALSSSLALALVEARTIPLDSALTYPTAGFSPGNVDFTELFSQRLPARKSANAASYQGWNLNLVNTLDPVPQAWAPDASVSPKQNLSNLVALYGEPVLPEVRITTSLLVIASRSSGVLYKPLPSQYFTGPLPPATPTNLEEFMKIEGQQHVQAYLDEVGIVAPPSQDSKTLAAGLTEKTDDKWKHYFVDFIEWVRAHPKEAEQAVEALKDFVERKDRLTEAEKENVFVWNTGWIASLCARQALGKTRE